MQNKDENSIFIEGLLWRLSEYNVGKELSPVPSAEEALNKRLAIVILTLTVSAAHKETFRGAFKSVLVTDILPKGPE